MAITFVHEGRLRCVGCHQKATSEDDSFHDECESRATPEEVVHLRDHLTDGRFHDECLFCRTRRARGGTGIAGSALQAAAEEV